PVDAAWQQRLACDNQPSDLGVALVQLHDLGVAHQLLHRVLLDETVAAVQLDRVVATVIAVSAASRIREEASVLRVPCRAARPTSRSRTAPPRRPWPCRRS